MKEYLKVGCEPDNSLSFLSKETLEEHREKFLEVADKIKNMLVDYPGYIGCDFCDVSANGIQIRGHLVKSMDGIKRIIWELTSG